jgi:hypothetical protein
MKGSLPDCGNKRSEQVLKQVFVVGQGCSSWVMSLMFSAEKTEMKWKNSWNNPRGLRSMAYSYKYVLAVFFELGYWSLREFRFFAFVEFMYGLLNGCSQLITI